METLSLTDCVPWSGKRDRDGYGTIGKVRAHRQAYIDAYGDIPDGLHVLHECDNPPCVNPAHLRLGTNLDNIQDKVRKGRARGQGKGSKHTNSKLTEADVTWIRESELPLSEMADILGVSVPTVSEASLGRTWTHVSTPPKRRKNQ